MIKELVLTSKNEIFFLGVAHSNSPEYLADLKEVIFSFHPDVVLLEGNFDKATFDSKEESIEKGSELGYVSFLCKSSGIPMFSNDPSNDETFNFVKKEFGEELSKGYFALRDLAFGPESQDIKQSKFVIAKALGEEFSDIKDYKDYFNPLLNLNKFNKVTRRLNFFRDNYMLNEILALMKPYKKLLVIKGDHHIKENFGRMKRVLQDA
jgi:hypothetical protein